MLCAKLALARVAHSSSRPCSPSRQRAAATRPIRVVQIIQGQKDTRVEPPFARQFHGEAQAEDKTLLEYEDAYHQLFQDRPDVTKRAMHDLSEWFLERVPS